MSGNGVTLKDVAKLANVSVGTVSRFINNHPSVSEKNRKKIQAAIERLNFSPNPIAQKLAKGVSNNLLLYIVQENPILTTTWLYELPVIQGICDYLKNQSYSLQIVLNFIEDNKGNYKYINECISSKSVDGILILSAWGLSNRTLIRLMDSGFPFVLLGNENTIQPTNDIIFDNYGAVKQLVEHLYHLGHRHIGLISGCRDQLHMSERIRGYFDTLKELGLEIDESWIKYGDYSMESGYACMQEILDSRHPTAVICGNDYMAAGAVKAIHERGYKVPDDFSVTGFDNSTVAKIVEPSLTTVSMPVFKAGQLATERLIEQLNSTDNLISREVLPCEIIIGSSTGKAKK